MKTNWIIGGSIVLAGLLLLIVPEFCVKIIVILFGVGAIAEGVYGITTERNIVDDELFQKTILYKSIGNIVIGVLAVLMPLAIAGAAWTIMNYVLAIYLIVAAAFGFFASSKLKDTDVDRKQFTYENLIVLGAGILLIVIGPKKLGVAILRIIGIAAILAGGVYLLLQIKNQKNNLVVADAEVSDDNTETENGEAE